MKTIHCFIFLVGLGSICCEEILCNSDMLQLHYLPEPIRVIGRASSSLQAEQVVINMTIETLSDQASESLAQNAKIANDSIIEFKNLGLDDSEFTTLGLQVFASYRSIYEQHTGGYKQVFEGYRVSNHLSICTKKFTLAGKLIDAAVQNGITQIDSIVYRPLPEHIILLKEKLLSQAVLDARKQADIMLEQLGYQIISLKSISQVENQQSYFPNGSPTAKGGDSATQLFSSSEIQSVQVEASFIIAPKGKRL